MLNERIVGGLEGLSVSAEFCDSAVLLLEECRAGHGQSAGLGSGFGGGLGHQANAGGGETAAEPDHSGGFTDHDHISFMRYAIVPATVST